MLRKPSVLLRVAALLGALTLAAPAAADDVPISDKAKAHFNAGVNYLQDPDGARYEEAYREFHAAYAESPSWKILGNLGLAAMKMERDGEAIEAYQKYLVEGGSTLDPDEKRQYETDLQTLQSGVVYVTLDSTPAGAVFTDQRVPVQGNPVVNRYEPTGAKAVLGIRPGHHKVVAQLAGYTDAVWEFEARSGSKEEHGFELKKAEEGAVTPPPPGIVTPPGGTPPAPAATTRPVPTGVIIGGVATGALAIGAGVVGFMAMGKKSDFDAKNDGLHTDDAKSLSDSGKTLNLVTDILIGGAVVAGVVTTVLYLGRPEVPAGGAQAGLQLAPSFGRKSAGLWALGRF